MYIFNLLDCYKCNKFGLIYRVEDYHFSVKYSLKSAFKAKVLKLNRHLKVSVI